MAVGAMDRRGCVARGEEQARPLQSTRAHHEHDAEVVAGMLDPPGVVQGSWSFEPRSSCTRLKVGPGGGATARGEGCLARERVLPMDACCCAPFFHVPEPSLARQRGAPCRYSRYGRLWSLTLFLCTRTLQKTSTLPGWRPRGQGQGAGMTLGAGDEAGTWHMPVWAGACGSHWQPHRAPHQSSPGEG